MGNGYRIEERSLQLSAVMLTFGPESESPEGLGRKQRCRPHPASASPGSALCYRARPPAAAPANCNRPRRPGGEGGWVSTKGRLSLRGSGVGPESVHVPQEPMACRCCPSGERALGSRAVDSGCIYFEEKSRARELRQFQKFSSAHDA